MSEERFDRIDTHLEGIVARLDGIPGRFDGIDRRLDGVDQRFDGVDKRLDELAAGQSRLEGRIESLDEQIETVDRHMHVLHEQTMATIAATGEHDSPTRREMREGFAEIRELIGRKTDPLNAIGRNHEQRITALEEGR